MAFFDESKSLVENLALLSAPLIFLISIIGLWQLRIAKNSLRVTSLRDAAKFSFEIIKEYDPKFDKAFYALTNAMEKNNIPEFEGEIVDFTMEEYNKIDSALRKKWENGFDKIPIEIVALTNLLESYSISFVKKIADEDIAFNVDCYVYIQLTTLCYPYIVKKYNEDKIHLYNENTIQLFKLWKARIDAMHNEKELIDLTKKIKSNSNKSIRPIGV